MQRMFYTEKKEQKGHSLSFVLEVHDLLSQISCEIRTIFIYFNQKIRESYFCVMRECQ